MDDVLYVRYRPTSFKQVVGQPEAVKTLTAMTTNGSFPRALLFTGNSGCGKTTLARIVRTRLKCGDADFVEMDAASNRGIEMVRSIQKRMGLAPISGDCRVWLIDECHQLTSDAQSAFLKILEDTPSHVYFMLATTDPQKLKPTIRTRCTEIAVKSMKPVDMQVLLDGVAGKAGIELTPDVRDKIGAHAEGSARKALVLLNAVAGIEGEEEQLQAIEASDVQVAAISLARLLLKPGVRWPEVAAVLKGLEEDPEGLRRMILGYCSAILLNGKQADKAFNIIDVFARNFFDSGKAGLVAACYEVVSAK